MQPSKHHDLGRLLEEVETGGYELPGDLPAIRRLTSYAVLNRYPSGVGPQDLDRQATLDLVQNVRAWAEKILEKIS